MKHSVWVLESDGDNREVVVAALRMSGFQVIAFDSVEALLARCDVAHPGVDVAAAVIDAWTARGREAALRATFGDRVLVLTTSALQERMWNAVGAPRCIRKPYDVWMLGRALRGSMAA
jgi:CheY-like chemotaxis protein